jgi:ubiquitin-activating enzyme E1 C
MVKQTLDSARSKLTLGRRKYLDRILNRPGPFTDPDEFRPGNTESVDRAKILWVALHIT